MLDARFAEASELTALVRDFSVHAFGPFLVADLRAARTPLVADALDPRLPAGLERLFVTATQARFTVANVPTLAGPAPVNLDTQPHPPQGSQTTTNPLRPVRRRLVVELTVAAATLVFGLLLGWLLSGCPGRSRSTHPRRRFHRR